ncbi:hypothetical protein [Pseudomonas sp.]|uniref:hypothetical protein n=1 Tax=Pseudomonas sp. TaxID=306 RepID=UPI003D6F8C87
MPDAIGGYFELELRKGQNPYPQALGFNSARSAFRALLVARRVSKVHLPHYLCNVMQEALNGTNIEQLRYGLSDELQLQSLPTLNPDEALLYVDYFGLKSDYIREVLAPHYKHQLIVDNSQALFSEPLPATATLYSPRKFVGVADGGWLVNAPSNLPTAAPSYSQGRFAALLGRLEDAPQQHYAAFQSCEQTLQQEGVKAMSASTARLLDSIDYAWIAQQRTSNLAHLRQRLDEHNLFTAWPSRPVAGLCYPLLLACAEATARLRAHLLEHSIFVPCYWHEVLQAAATPAIERSWAQCLLPLPIDQRYSVDDMDRLADTILQHMRTS